MIEIEICKNNNNTNKKNNIITKKIIETNMTKEIEIMMENIEIIMMMIIKTNFKKTLICKIIVQIMYNQVINNFIFIIEIFYFLFSFLNYA